MNKNFKVKVKRNYTFDLKKSSLKIAFKKLLLIFMKLWNKILQLINKLKVFEPDDKYLMIWNTFVSLCIILNSYYITLSISFDTEDFKNNLANEYLDSYPL
jgi:hypothetical protein